MPLPLGDRVDMRVFSNKTIFITVTVPTNNKGDFL